MSTVKPAWTSVPRSGKSSGFLTTTLLTKQFGYGCLLGLFVAYSSLSLAEFIGNSKITAAWRHPNYEAVIWALAGSVMFMAVYEYARPSNANRS